MGRQTSQSDYQSGVTGAVYSKTATYAANGALLTEYTTTKRYDNVTYGASSTYTYNLSGTGEYLLGAVGTVTTYNYKNSSYQNASSTVNAYQWWDSAVQSAITYKPDTSKSTTYTTTFTLDGQGILTNAYIGDGRPRSIVFRTNGDGQMIRRDETDNNYNATTGGDPHEIWYRFGGVELGYVGNNGTSQTSTPTSIGDRRTNPGTGAFRNGASYMTSTSDFAQSSDAINSFSQGSTAGGYTARAGDTLRSVAQQLWGDSSLWYKLAEANGIQSEMALAEGQRLNVPAGISRTSHNATTFRPYDASEATGNVSPTIPKPQKKNKCGVFGQILLAAVAIAVTAIVAPQLIGVAANATTGAAATGLTATLGATGGSIVGGGLAAAAGSIVSQGVGVATGIQSKFNFTGVALAAIGGAIGGGLGKFNALGDATTGSFKGIANAAIRGATANALSQGISVATGLQSKFDFVGVAAAGVGGGVSQFAGSRTMSLGNFSGSLVSNTASAMANAATRSAIQGTSFGDNLMRALPDAIGSTIGNLVANGISRSPKIAYEEVGSNDGVIAGVAVAGVAVGGVSGAEDGTLARPVAGVAGGGQVGGSDDGTLSEIVVIADPEMKYMFGVMTDYQFGRYYEQYGDTSFKEGAMWALGLTAPAAPVVTSSFGPVSSYESPLIQSLRTARPYGLYSDGPAQQYMLGDGSVFTGTPSALAQFKQQRAVQANIAYIDRVRSSPIGGIALGISHEMGASAATQDLLFGLGSSADGLLMAYGGVRGATIPGSNNQTSLAIEANLRLRYMSDWTAEQRAAADLKVRFLDLSETTVSQSVRGGFSASSRYAREYGPVAKGYDIDHLRDLQLGGSNTLSNLWPLDASVNRSLGAQIQNQIRDLPPGTRVNRVTIGN